MKEATMGAVAEGQTDKARRALEQVCARGDFQAAQELYSGEFLDHVNGMDFHGQLGIRKSVGLYLAIFPDLVIDDEAVRLDRPGEHGCLRRTSISRAAS